MTSERVSDERLEELDNSACDQIARHPDGLWSDMSATEAHAILTELQSLRSAREAEPVAYRVRMDRPFGGVWQLRQVLHEWERWDIIQPLYLHPSPSIEGLENMAINVLSKEK